MPTPIPVPGTTDSKTDDGRLVSDNKGGKIAGNLGLSKKQRLAALRQVVATHEKCAITPPANSAEIASRAEALNSVLESDEEDKKIPATMVRAPHVKGATLTTKKRIMEAWDQYVAKKFLQESISHHEKNVMHAYTPFLLEIKERREKEARCREFPGWESSDRKQLHAVQLFNMWIIDVLDSVKIDLFGVPDLTRTLALWTSLFGSAVPMNTKLVPKGLQELAVLTTPKGKKVTLERNTDGLELLMLLFFLSFSCIADMNSVETQIKPCFNYLVALKEKHHLLKSFAILLIAAGGEDERLADLEALQAICQGEHFLHHHLGVTSEGNSIHGQINTNNANALQALSVLLVHCILLPQMQVIDKHNSEDMKFHSNRKVQFVKVACTSAESAYLGVGYDIALRNWVFETEGKLALASMKDVVAMVPVLKQNLLHLVTLDTMLRTILANQGTIVQNQSTFKSQLDLLQKGMNDLPWKKRESKEPQSAGKRKADELTSDEED